MSLRTTSNTSVALAGIGGLANEPNASADGMTTTRSPPARIPTMTVLQAAHDLVEILLRADLLIHEEAVLEERHVTEDDDSR